MRRPRAFGVGGFVGLALLAACVGGEGIGVNRVVGYEGLGRQLQTFYAQRAWEKSASCPTPTMERLTAAEILEETEDTIVLRVRYSWQDESRNDSDNLTMPGGGSRCRGIDERRFTLRKFEDGGVKVVDMSGSQRSNPLGAMRS